MKPLTDEHVQMLGEICELAETVNKPPAFQFYVQDWLGSSTILGMTPAQEGAYIRLLACCWDKPQLAIPNDSGKLSLMSRLNHEWKDLGPSILDSFFCEHPVLGPKWLTNIRLIEVRHHQLVKQIEAAKSRRLRGKSHQPPTNPPTDDGTDVLTDVGTGDGTGKTTLPGSQAPRLPGSQTDELSTSQERESPSPSADGLALAQFLQSELVRVRPTDPASKFGGTALDKHLASWGRQFDDFGRIDKVTPETYRAIIKWAMSNKFWRTNIGSPHSLRTLKKGASAKVWVDFGQIRGSDLGNYGERDQTFQAATPVVPHQAQKE